MATSVFVEAKRLTATRGDTLFIPHTRPDVDELQQVQRDASEFLVMCDEYFTPAEDTFRRERFLQTRSSKAFASRLLHQCENRSHLADQILRSPGFQTGVRKEFEEACQAADKVARR